MTPDSNEPLSDATPADNQPDTPADKQLVDPRAVVYQMGNTVTKDPREIIENPAVTPEMLNEPGDLRMDVTEED